ncbi:hypothetical protein [uncultured Psychroserpens sp.]|nr:hypothetical protein [uncultured Psychroserpens sp.]
MKVIIIIVVIVVLIAWAYFFPKGVKIFGIPAETLFSKEDPEDEDFK